MRLSINAFLTADGVMQGPGGADEDPRNGFDRGGWLVPYIDDDFGRIVDGWFTRAGAILLGRTTYDMMHPYWRQVTDPDNLVAAKLNGLPKYVVSTTLADPVWEHTTVIASDVVDEVAKLKEGDTEGELQVHGSCALAQTLHAAGLVDEYRLLIFPVLVGDGKRLFGQAAASGLTLVDSSVTGAGAVYSAYTPAPFRIGRVGVEDGHEI